MIGTYEEAKERSEAVAKELFDIVNGAEHELAEALIDAFLHEHPTLMQQFVGVMQKVILAHTKHKRVDGRNKSSVNWAKQVSDLTEGFSGFPFI
ncbi:MAG: hypothetical protein ACXAEN_22400 [Candidatus Thorarchaeota archaeon]|jgi:hypothetical protein